MRKTILILALLASPALAQTVSPVIVECGRKCNGEFSFKNNQLEAMNVVVEPASFSLDPATGRSVYRPLDSTAQVLMNEMSTRIGPHGEHLFDYSIQCSAYPCMVVLRTSAVIGHTDEGLAIRVTLPHVIYVCQKSKNCRADARKAAGLKE